MRVTLLHNPTAGPKELTGTELVRLVRAAGHEVHYQSTDEDDYARALADPGALVLVAGGDGTVRKAARRLTRRDVPLALIPLGTSNNIASALGVRGEPREIIAGLPDAVSGRLDVGTARGPWGTERFVESAGVGFFAAILHPPRPPGRPGSTEEHRMTRIEQGVRHARGVLDRAPTRPCRIECDGEDCSGDYLLVLALNIGCVGPRLWLAPDADPGDGRLDLLLVRNEDRHPLGRYMDELLQGREIASPLPVRRAARIGITWNHATGHLDDEPWPGSSGEAGGTGESVVELAIDDPPLTVLVGRPDRAPEHPPSKAGPLRSSAAGGR